MPTPIEQTAHQTAEHHRMFPEGAPVLAMVSGGADSVSMLHLLASGRLGPLTVEALHLNHMIRGISADEDELFVERLCDELQVPCHVVRYDVSAYAASNGLNLEDAGRRIRYRFADERLDAMASAARIDPERGRIAVAHTLDDRVETFFMRAVAGSGTGALGSIAAVRGRVVRPLLECTRSDVREWLSEKGLAWREDESNEDTARSRAMVRSELLPVLERMNPSFRESLSRTMDLLADDDRLLTEMAEAFVRDFTEIVDGVEVSFNRQWMTSLERTMARRSVKMAVTKAFPDVSRIEAQHIEALVDGLMADHFSHDLPGGLRAWSEYDRMVVAHSQNAVQTVAPALLSLPGEAELGPAGTLRAQKAEPIHADGTPDSVVIDADKVAGDLVVDAVHAGDRMRPLGMQGSRKLSDLLIDEKVPKRLREAVPVVRDGDHIVWVAGVRMSEEYKISEKTERAYRLIWERGAAWQ